MKNIAANFIRHEDKMHIKEQKLNVNVTRKDKSFVLYKIFTLAVDYEYARPKSIVNYENSWGQGC